MMKIDLNADLGESFGIYHIGNDERLMPLISSANIACGFHAGDPSVMRRSVALCLEHDVAIGAHPGLPDLQGFGRRAMAVTAEEAHDVVLYQIGALRAFVEAEGGRLRHVKPHGALYHMTIEDRALARAVAEAIYKASAELIVVGFPESALLHEAEQFGLRTASEAFIDRAYNSDGTLVSRAVPGAVIAEVEQAVAQALGIIIDKKVTSIAGTDVAIEAQTLCIHGDSMQAVQMAQRVVEVLAGKNISITAMR